MILTYKACMAGPYHIENDIPCQDAFCVKHGGDGIVVAAVADGLGSEKHSDVGAKVASEVAVEHCAEKIGSGMMKEEVLETIKESFKIAYEAVVTVARSKAEPEEEYPEDEYDCTLCLAVFDGTKVYFGQSGDSGMIARLNDGTYVKVTEQQRDGWGRVYPLCFGEDEWVFGQVEGDVEAVMLMTDGVWEEVCALSPEEENEDEAASEVNEILAKPFLDLRGIGEKELPVLEETVRKYLEDYPRELIDDDKTVVVMFHKCEEEETITDLMAHCLSTICDALKEKATSMLCRLITMKTQIDEQKPVEEAVVEKEAMDAEGKGEEE